MPKGIGRPTVKVTYMSRDAKYKSKICTPVQEDSKIFSRGALREKYNVTGLLVDKILGGFM
jgi:hypothetical protein